MLAAFLPAGLSVFLALANEMVALEYTSEIARYGYVDRAVALPSLDRLDQLCKHNNAWNKLDGVRSESIPKLPGSQILSVSILARTGAPGSLIFTRLPSYSRSVGQQEWSVPSPDLHIFLVEWPRLEPNPSFQIHLCCMSNGKAHGLVSVPILKCPHNVPQSMMSNTIQISGDHLGAESHDNDSPTELVVWNWKTGHKELVLTGNEIQLHLLIVDFIAESSGQTRVTNVTHCLARRIPSLHPSPILFRFIIKCNPSPTWPNEDDSIPFHVHPDEILSPVALNMVQGFEQYWMIILIPRRTLLAQLRHFLTGTKEVEWSAWDLEGTCIFDFWKRANWNGTWATFGSRSVAFDSNYVEIEVYDFNQVTLTREQNSGCPLQYGNPNKILRPTVNPDDPTILVIDETVLPSDGLIFQEEVRTSLPFRARIVHTALERGHGYNIMCRQDSIIIVSSEYHVFTF
ncbi:hypothetical protein IW262DRAFT_1456100 [Armillaria fumosa]|nr:hypothetical protein IW262DRAFT_1469852 [Armillaria fumosa]KAK0228889.1 hypothetical protein IW262DRAFT_1456100 [Armillaria fumosa]